MNLKTRFAPTPSGFLHEGNIFSLLLTWLIARKNKGRIFLRIDDLDGLRTKKSYTEDIFRTLEWLGLDYDEGPSGVEDFYANYSQLKRLELYEKALTNLEKHGLTFNCVCSRSEIINISPDGNYPGTCLESITEFNKPLAIRLITLDDTVISFKDHIRGPQKIDIQDEMRHFIVRRKDKLPSYQLASLVDDDHFGINCIVRGEDLLSSTAAQLYLARQLNYSSFISSQFYHHPLLYRGSQKLSKSQGHSFSDGNGSDQHKKQVLREFANWMGLDYKIDNLKDLLDRFQMTQLQQLGQASD